MPGSNTAAAIILLLACLTYLTAIVLALRLISHGVLTP